MKNMRCYGRKKVIVPKEKSFIKNFFDGNESSDFSANVLSSYSEDKRQEANAKECKENSHLKFDSPNLFKEDFPWKQKKKYGMRSVADPNYENERINCSENKENMECLSASPVLFRDEDEFPIEEKKNNGRRKVPKPKQVAKNKVNYARKKVKGIQHLSTKYCKSLQPCWEEFEKHDLNIEKPLKANNLGIIEQKHNNSEALKDIKQNIGTLPSTSAANNGEASQVAALTSETHIYSKRIKSISSRLHFPSNETFESSGELFTKTPKYKKSTKRNSKKEKKNLRGKNSNKLSHNVVSELEEKINQCMQNVDFSEACDKDINSKVSNCKKNIYTHDSALQETIPIKNSTTVPFVEIIPINNGFSDATDEVSKSSKNQELVSVDTFAISAKNKFSVSVRCNNKVNNFENSQHSHKKLSNLFNTHLEILGHSNNGNLSLSPSADLCKGDNLIQNISKIVTLHQTHQKTDSDKLQSVSIEATAIQNSQNSNASCRLTTDNISDKQVYINQDETNCIQPKLFEEIKMKDSIINCDLSHELQPFENNSNISLNKNTNSLHSDVKILQNSSCKKHGTNTLPLSPNISCIIKTYNACGLKCKGKFVTSTPVTNKSKFHNFVNAEMITLNNDENISGLKACSKQYASFCEKVTGNKCVKPDTTETPINSFINISKKAATSEILEPLQCLVSPNLRKSRTSLPVSNKSITHPILLKKTQSLLNISSINQSPEEEKPDDFTKIKLLELCDQDSVTPFANIYDWKNFKVKKIGEGTYGEVFMLSKGKISSVLKVIPISEDPNVKNLQGLSSVYSEIKISKSLSELRCNQMNHSKNFVKVNRSSVVSGSYPSVLMEAWDDFSKDRSTYNDRPDIYSEDQMFVILELEYGGKDMSSFTLRNAVEAEVILKQIAVSLAVAEEEFSFEHRDLHLGNILVKRSRSKTVSYKIRGRDISFQCLGLQVTIIDFTLSLLSDKGYIYYYDLAEDSLFDQTGDYQFDVYKSMRRHLENKWEECSLYSNILWLKYLCKKMKESKYTHPTAVTHKRGLKAIDSFNTQLMKCSCALECLEKCGITKTVFKKSMSDTLRRSILVSRNSIQKSKLSICN